MPRHAPQTVTVAQYLTLRLKEIGVGHIFAVPGDYAGAFLTTVDHTDGIARIGTTSELVAGYAADGYARLRGVGAACVTYGVGTFSILNALAGSYVEQLPVILIVGSPSLGQRSVERTQGVLYHHSTGTVSADEDSVRNVVVAREVITGAWRAPRQIDRALAEAVRWRRPVYIEVCADIWGKETSAPEGRIVPEPLPLSQAHLARAVDIAAERLDKARTPVVWAGLEIQRYGLQRELLALLKATRLPYATDLLGKGVLPESTPGFVGTYDGASAPQHLRRLLETSDCILGIGNLVTDDFLDLVQKNFHNLVLAYGNAVRAGGRRYGRVPIVAFMRALLDRLEPQKYKAPRDAKATLSAIPTLTAVASKQLAAAGLRLASTGPAVTYDAFFERMRTWVDDTMVLMPDTTIALYSAAELPVAQDGFLAQAAWNSIGYTPGGALGAGYADPARRPVVFCGDGGFQMTAQALSDIVRAGHGTVVFIFNNSIYGIEQAFVNVKFFTGTDEIEAFDVLHRWNYAKLAEVFGGGMGFVVSTLDELDAALEQVKRADDRLSIVDLRIPEKDITPQMLALAGGGT